MGLRIMRMLRLRLTLGTLLAAMVLSASAIEPLKDVQQIRALTREQAARALPVKLSGVVVYVGATDLVLHDGKASIYLDFVFAQKHGVWQGALPDFTKFNTGTGVEIEGVTDPGGFSPMVMVAKFKSLGPQPLPPPIRSNIEDLLSSSHDSQWIEVEGVVRKMEISDLGVQSMTMLVGGHTCQVILTNPSGLSPNSLVDARIRLRGVLLNIVNLRSQTAGLKIHSTGANDIDVLTPPPQDPFRAPKVALNRLVSFQPNADLGHRRVSSGVVTFVVPGRFFYLMDQEVSVRVESSETAVVAGDVVEVSGFLDTSTILASFSGALVRKTGTGPVPVPAEPSVDEILNPKTRSAEEMVSSPGYPDQDGRLIRLRGVLRRVLMPDKDGNTILVVESGERLVRVLLPGAAPPWVVGSAVELTGVCQLEMERTGQHPWFKITDFRLWLSGPSDVRVESLPPWWTPQRLGIMLVTVLLVLLAALVWGYVMRRQVAIRGKQLGLEIAARESAQIEFDTILHERRRLANDLHDTLEQALTGLAMQLEIASRSRSADPEKSAHHLELARNFLERSRAEAHRAIWDLRAHGQDGRGFMDILGERVASMVEGSDIKITLQEEGGPLALSDLLAGNLLLLAQEAVTNALKHSGASEIRILMRRSASDIELLLEDNGRGFDPAGAPGQHDGHFGLQGMRERTKRIGGQLELVSRPGQGTSIRLRVKLESLPETLREPA